MRRRRVGWPYIVITAVFLASRLGYHLLGVHFDTSPLNSYEQYADPLLLRTDLLRTLVFLHVNPPLFNLTIGLALKWFGTSTGTALHLLFFASGLALATGIYAVMTALGAWRWLSVLVTILMTTTPATALFENWLYVDYLVAAVLVLATWTLHRYSTTGHSLWAALFCLLLGLCVMSRSFFAVYWLAAEVAIILIFLPGKRRALLLWAMLPVTLSLMLYAKNYFLFGSFTSATPPLGLQPYEMTTVQLRDRERKELISEGKISRLSELNPFFVDVKSLLVPGARKLGVPVTDELIKSTGYANFNNLGYLALWSQYQRDAIATFQAKPETFVRHERQAWLLFFQPPADYPFFSATNEKATSSIVSITNRLEFGQIRRVRSFDGDPAAFAWSSIPDRLAETGWTLVVAYAVAAVVSLRLLAARFRSVSAIDAPVFAFIVFTVAYIVLAGNTFEGVENNRWQFVADPLVLCLLTVAFVRWRNGKGVPASPPPPNWAGEPLGGHTSR